MPYLGQQDSTLPMRPTDLAPREDVIADPRDWYGPNCKYADRIFEDLRQPELRSFLHRALCFNTGRTDSFDFMSAVSIKISLQLNHGQRSHRPKATPH